MRCQYVAATAALVIALGACRDRDQRTDVRTLSADELARQGKLTLGDSQVVVALRAPNVAGRIVYDPPVDLSLANAMRTRPDLVGRDTTGRDPRTTTRRDTTGGDATADTSGGAARPRRQP